MAEAGQQEKSLRIEIPQNAIKDIPTDRIQSCAEIALGWFTRDVPQDQRMSLEKAQEIVCNKGKRLIIDNIPGIDVDKAIEQSADFRGGADATMVANLYRAFYGLDQLPGSNVTFVFPDATTATNSSEVAASEGDTFTVTAVASTPLSAEPSADDPSDTQVIDSRVLDPNIRILDDSAPDAGRDDSLDAATPPVSSTPNTTTEAAAESAPAAMPPQSASVPADLGGTWDVADNDDWNHGQSNSVVSVSEAMSRTKKTYGRPISDRIDRNSSRIFGIAGFTTLAAVGLAIATPVVGAIGLGAFAWGAAALAAKATVGLIGFGAAGKLLRSSLRVFEGEKATTQRRLADEKDAKRQGILGELIQQEAQQYEDELREQLGLPAPVATAAPAPAVVAAPAPDPVAAPAPVVVEQSAPVATAAPAREPVAVEQPAPVTTVTPEPAVVAAPPAPVVVAAPAREPVAVEQPAPVAVSHGWVDSYPYDLYLSDKPTQSINFVESSPVNLNSDATLAKSVSLDLSYKFSTIDEFVNMWGLSQQRAN
jgi:hypothetical protein